MFHYYASASIEEIQPWKQTAFCILLNIHRTFSKMMTFLLISWWHTSKAEGKNRKKPNHVPMHYFNLKKLKAHLDSQNTGYTYKVNNSNLF